MTSPADEQLSLNVFSGPAGRKRPPAPGQRWAAKQKRRRGCSQESRQRSPAPGAKEQVRAPVAPPPQPTARAPLKKKQRRQEEKEERKQEAKEERKQEEKEERKQEEKEERKQEAKEERKQEERKQGEKEERKQEEKEGRKKEERKQEKKEERKQERKEERKQEAVKETGRSSIKTSSLFKHNPSIPDITRPDVCQRKEEIFTSDSFSGLCLHPHLVATLNKVLNVSTLTSVQQQTIPALLEGRDALVRSQTGSGKTLSYAVPLVQSLQAVQPKISRSDGPLALVIVPTRELALQTFQIFQKLLKPFTWIVPGVLMGGEKRKAEKARLRRGINVLVCTPGRLLDHIRNTLSLAFSAVRWLVLDEADRTLDLGFQKDLTVILNSLNAAGPARQNVLLSATLTPGLTQLADVCLKDPVSIQVSSSSPSDLLSPPTVTSDPEAAGQSESFAVPEELKQFVVVVPSKVRLVCLAAFILDKCKGSQNKLVVFVSSCEAVEFLHLLFSSVLPGPSANHKLSFLRLHGNMKQEDRSEAFQMFSAAPCGVLLCTDVAARGLDLPQVSWIVQFTPPPSVAEYVHRVGRTARMGGRGSSLLFLTPAEVAFLSLLEGHAISLSEMKLQDILSCLMVDDTYKGRGKYHSQSSSRARQQEVQERATVLQTQLEDFVHSGADSLLAAKKALQSYLRSYTCYPTGLRHVFSLASLHLGHAAKSFGLRDAPRGLAAATGGGAGGKTGTRTGTKTGTGGKAVTKTGTKTGTRSPAKNQKQNQNQNRAAGKKRSGPGVLEARLLRSEFSSGLQAAAGRKKKKKKKKEEEEEEE